MSKILASGKCETKQYGRSPIDTLESGCLLFTRKVMGGLPLLFTPPSRESILTTSLRGENALTEGRGRLGRGYGC